MGQIISQKCHILLNLGSNGSLIHISIKSYCMCGSLSRRSASWHCMIWPYTDPQYKDISSPRNNFLPPQNWMIHHLASIWIVEIFPVGMQRCQFARKSTDNRSMQLKLIVLETLSFPERFHALRKGPFVAPGSP